MTLNLFHQQCDTFESLKHLSWQLVSFCLCIVRRSKKLSHLIHLVCHLPLLFHQSLIQHVSFSFSRCSTLETISSEAPPGSSSPQHVGPLQLHVCDPTVHMARS